MEYITKNSAENKSKSCSSSRDKENLIQLTNDLEYLQLEKKKKKLMIIDNSAPKHR